MTFDTRRTSIGVLLSVLLVTGANARRAPLRDPHASSPDPLPAREMSDPVDPAPDGWINRTTGTVVTLINQEAGPYSGAPERVARAYLEAEAARLGLGRDGIDLQLESVRTSPAGRHVRFRQEIGGLPVWRGELVVTLDPTATRVRAIHSAYDPILAHSTIRTSPAFDAATARRIALDAVGIEGEPSWIGEASEALWVVRGQDRIGSPARIAWRVLLPVAEPMGDWEVFVDATDRTVLRMRDQMVYADGSGYVFDPDPLTTAEEGYGGNYADNSDDDTAELNAERRLRILKDLTYQGGVYHLEGPYVELVDFEEPWGNPVTEVDPDGFTYARSEQGFEDVMCYYFLDTSQRYIQSLGFNDIQNGPIECDPHGLNGADNSHYVPSQNRVAFGEGGVDDGEDADVILHEYGHAIQYDIVPSWGGGHQGAMGEGFGDYWAGSHSAAVSLYNWQWVFNWDGHNNFWPGRILNSTKHYPEDLAGDVHADGEIWSAAWMQIYFECGRTVTDTDMLAHHYYQGGSATMAEAAMFAMQADVDIYGGLHAGSLNEYFTERGFFTEGQFDIPVLNHPPLADQTTAGPYPIRVTIESTSDITRWSVRAKYGTGEAFDQITLLEPSGNPDEWIGELPNEGGDVDMRYYIEASNEAGWKGVHPRGAEYQYHEFHIGPLVAVEEAVGAAALLLMPADPNPFGSATTLRFRLPRDGEVRFTVHDPGGRVVRTLAAGMHVAGTHAYVWDGRNDAGREMPSGLYFARIAVDERSLTGKILLAR